MQNTERKLATIRKVAEVQPIKDADRIEAVRVDGWWVVAKKGEFPVDSLCIYVEIDSFVPTAIAPFLTKAGYEPKVYEGIQGERLRTVRLKKQLSQGLLLPVVGFDAYFDGAGAALFKEYDDVTDFLGIIKYEKPLPAALAGMAKGLFPSFIPKTDQTRIQNLGRELQAYSADHTWSVTEKLDGSSMTAYVNHNELDEEGAPAEAGNAHKHGVCSRNLELKFDTANSFWEAEVKYDLIEKIKSTNRSLAIQGELIGEGIQGNPYKLIGRQFYCFDIWDIDQQCYLMPIEMFALCKLLGIPTVPEINPEFVFDGDCNKALLQADGNSVIGCKPKREGLVFKSNQRHDASFKCISNAWLLGGGDE